jgi:hypothetical protein
VGRHRAPPTIFFTIDKEEEEEKKSEEEEEKEDEKVEGEGRGRIRSPLPPPNSYSGFATGSHLCKRRRRGSPSATSEKSSTDALQVASWPSQVCPPFVLRLCQD